MQLTPEFWIENTERAGDVLGDLAQTGDPDTTLDSQLEETGVVFQRVDRDLEHEPRRLRGPGNGPSCPHRDERRRQADLPTD